MTLTLDALGIHPKDSRDRSSLSPGTRYLAFGMMSNQQGLMREWVHALRTNLRAIVDKNNPAYRNKTYLAFKSPTKYELGLVHLRSGAQTARNPRPR